MSDQTNKKGADEVLEEFLGARSVIFEEMADTDSIRLQKRLRVAWSALVEITPDIEEGLKLLAIKRLASAMDDGNSGFIQVGDR